MQAGDIEAAAVIEPYHDPVSLRISASVFGAGHTVTRAAAGDDEEWLEGPRIETLSDIGNHGSAFMSAHRLIFHPAVRACVASGFPRGRRSPREASPGSARRA